MNLFLWTPGRGTDGGSSVEVDRFLLSWNKCLKQSARFFEPGDNSSQQLVCELDLRLFTWSASVAGRSLNLSHYKAMKDHTSKLFYSLCSSQLIFVFTP